MVDRKRPHGACARCPQHDWVSLLYVLKGNAVYGVEECVVNITDCSLTIGGMMHVAPHAVHLHPDSLKSGSESVKRLRDAGHRVGFPPGTGAAVWRTWAIQHLPDAPVLYRLPATGAAVASGS